MLRPWEQPEVPARSAGLGLRRVGSGRRAGAEPCEEPGILDSHRVPACGSVCRWGTLPSSPGLSSQECLGSTSEPKPSPGSAEAVTKAVMAEAEGSPAGDAREERHPRALADLLLLKVQAQEVDGALPGKEASRRAGCGIFSESPASARAAFSVRRQAGNTGGSAWWLLGLLINRGL